MVINPAGYVIGCVSGEGKRDVLEQLIEQVIQQHKQKGTMQDYAPQMYAFRTFFSCQLLRVIATNCQTANLNVIAPKLIFTKYP